MPVRFQFERYSPQGGLGIDFALFAPFADPVLLEQASAIDKLFALFDARLKASGYLAQGGQIIDATVIAAPRQKLSDDEKAMIKVGKAADEIWPDAPAKPRPRRRRGHVRCCQPPVESVTIGIYPEREVRILEGR